MSTPNMNAPLTGCTTIDSSPIPPDNGYLANARAGTPAGANASTQDAADNLSACLNALPPGPANIVGHGDEGDIDTGAVAGQCITLANQAQWGPILTALNGSVTELFLFGCSVGAGQAGLNLLTAVAGVVGAPVTAPTGLIFCDDDGNFSLDAGAVWQTVAPAAPAAPIEAPQHLKTGRLMTPANASPETSRIQAALYVSKDKVARGWSAEDSFKLADEVIWEAGFVPPGPPGAKVTGTLLVTFEGQAQALSYTVYNNSLLRKDGTSTYYHTTSTFQSIASSQ